MSGGDSKTGGFTALIIFLAALVAGTFCSLTSKVMLSMKSVGLSGEEENFSYPLFQTFGMFLGMLGGLGLHYLVLAWKIPFPGYDHSIVPTPTPYWMHLLLIFPSVFDLIATTLCMFGLKYINVSIYQMLRGSAIVFVALLKQFLLGDKLKSFMWVGIFWNVISIVLVGLTAIMVVSDSGENDGGESNPLLGVVLILCGAVVQSLQYAFEEKVMTVTEGNESSATPPLMLIGMEGFWGTVICLFILYPLAYYTPGPDHGCIENPFNTIELISNSPDIQRIFILYFFSILAYNILACLVTFLLSSVWHAILDNFRPVTVWGVDLFIFYSISRSFGEAWINPWSWMQVLGMVVLLYGTAIYNAPHAGSIKLTGGLMHLFMDFTYEYEEIEEAALDQKFSDGTKSSPYYSTMSPLPSPGMRLVKRTPERDLEMKDSTRLLDRKADAKGYSTGGR